MQRPMPFRARKPMPGKPGGKLMADGGLGAPEPIGGPAATGGPPSMPSKPPAPAPGGGMDPEMDGDMNSPGVSPEAVHYHDEAQSCSGCQFMGGDQQCSVLKMQVNPDGGCNAFTAKMDQGEGMGGAPGEDAGEDIGGGPGAGGY